MKKLLFIFIGFIMLLASCKKADLAGNDATGEGLVPFSLRTPTSGTNLVLNAATPNATVDITWNPSTPGLNTQPTYKWIAALKATGNLESPVISIPSGNGGKDAKLTLTYKQIDDALKAAGVADGAKTYRTARANCGCFWNYSDLRNRQYNQHCVSGVAPASQLRAVN